MSHNKQKYFDETLKQYYKILRCRQSQIIGIIKETTDLVETLDLSPDFPEFDKNQDRRVKLAFSMINALSNILDEQVKALNIWERILDAEEVSGGSLPNVEGVSLTHYEVAAN